MGMTEQGEKKEDPLQKKAGLPSVSWFIFHHPVKTPPLSLRVSNKSK